MTLDQMLTIATNLGLGGLFMALLFVKGLPWLRDVIKDITAGVVAAVREEIRSVNDDSKLRHAELLGGLKEVRTDISRIELDVRDIRNQRIPFVEHRATDTHLPGITG